MNIFLYLLVRFTSPFGQVKDEFFAQDLKRNLQAILPSEQEVQLRKLQFRILSRSWIVT